MDKFYFAGGIYPNKERNLEFAAVRPTGSLPYVTKDKDGLLATAHHASLYELSEDFSEATLIFRRSRRAEYAPRHVKLPKKLQSEMKQVIADNVFHE